MVTLAVLNLMPLKEATESDFLRLIGFQQYPVEIHWMRLRTHTPKHASKEHMDAFYKYFDELTVVPDGLIVTGAPVEQLPFEEVTYWPELCGIFNWASQHVKSTIYVCWAAQAALYHFHGIPKYPLPQKLFGIFPQQLSTAVRHMALFEDFGQEFMMPHSRHTEIRQADVEACPALHVASGSPVTGPSIVIAREGRDVFITGHIEYATDTLDSEYRRDQQRGRTDVGLPLNYYPDDDVTQPPLDTWHDDALRLYRNWIRMLN